MNSDFHFIKGSEAAALGSLSGAGQLLSAKSYKAAWESVIQAIAARPFHPSAYLMLARIAQAADDSPTAQKCLEKAAALTPGWTEVKSMRMAASGPAQLWPELDTILAQRLTNRLSVCMIVKNEEAFLGQCLASVHGLAFETIVVDTGSTDRTVEIARQHGARVYHHQWNDDFSAARNAGLIHARGDWILVLDADEELTADSREILQSEMLNPKAAAYYLKLVNKGREDEGATRLARMFRNLPGAGYESRIHEQVFGSVMNCARGWGLEYLPSNATILHHGYTPEITANRDKVQRNLRLLKQAINEPGTTALTRANLLMNLGLETVRADQLEAGITYYQQALALVHEQLKLGMRPSPEFRATLIRQLSTHLVRARRYPEVIDLFNSPLAKSGSLAASDHYAWGLACFETGRVEEAAKQFQACLSKREEPDAIAINTGILTANPHHCLALALARLNRLAEAESVCRTALAQFPDSQDLRLLCTRLVYRQGRPVDALKALNQMLGACSHLPEVWLLGGEIVLSNPQFYDFGLDWTGEAARIHASDPRLNAQRRELLLLKNATSDALSLNRNLSENLDHRSLAAIVFCEAIAGGGIKVPDEPKVSQAFIDFYRRLIAANASDPIRKLNANLDALERTLPTASRFLKQALAAQK